MLVEGLKVPVATEASDETSTIGDSTTVEQNAEVEAQPEEEVVVSIGDKPADENVEEDESQPAPVWVKKVRQRNRELERELKEARQQLKTATDVKEPELGEKPTLQGCEYDTDKYEQELTSWHDKKRKADEKVSAGEKAWQTQLDTYQKAKTVFRPQDFDEAEAVVLDLLDVTQQGIIVHGATDAALVVYALGRNEKEAKELAAIKDPVKFAFAVAKLEGQLKVTTKKPTTAPEGRVLGNGRPSGSIDKTLDRLREEAAKTGNYTKVIEYKRSKKG